MDDHQIASYLATLAVERKAWEAVEDCLPGSRRFDMAKWVAWRQAVKASDEARRALPLPSPVASSPARRRDGETTTGPDPFWVKR